MKSEFNAAVLIGTDRGKLRRRRQLMGRGSVLHNVMGNGHEIEGPCGVTLPPAAKGALLISRAG